MGMNGPAPAVERAKLSAMVDDRRARVASYKVRGLSIRQIRVKLAEDGCINPKSKEPWSLGILSKDLKVLTGEWRASAAQDTGTWKAAELEKLDQVEREAWAAWFRGIGKKQKTITEKGSGGKGEGRAKASVVTEQLNGDPRYLEVIQRCQQARRAMLGLDAATKVEQSGPGGAPIALAQGGPDLSKLSVEQLRLYRSILAVANGAPAAPAAEPEPEKTAEPFPAEDGGATPKE